ncbi:hypothetical protein [Haloferula sp. BvORR071]|uniref:hypothetical protein n=1 Tax=Haloferula sp. BvORR071 TaxID=1396141 RepID=UPI000557EB27|nr:hypothetical protein [Haloferula sp. BvORR071]
MKLVTLFLALLLSSAVTGCASSKSKSNWKASKGTNKGWASSYAKTLDKKKETNPEVKTAPPPEIPKGARDPRVESGSPQLDGEQIVIPDRVLPEGERN